MRPRPLLVVLAAVFAGLSMLLVVTAAVTATPLVLLAAVPLAITALLMWYQGTGRLGAGLFGRRRGRRRRGTRTTAGATFPGGDHGADDRRGDAWETTFREEAARAARTRARRQARKRARRQSRRNARNEVGASGTASNWANRRERADRIAGLTRAEAYDVLDLDPAASDEAVREAYREKAKTAHPDTEGGSAESFQELNDAYELLVGD